MSKFQIARYTTKTAAAIAPEYGTFETVEAAADFLVFELLVNREELNAGESNYYVTFAQEVVAA